MVSCGVSWEREKDDAEGWGRVFGSGRRMLTRRWGGGFFVLELMQVPRWLLLFSKDCMLARSRGSSTKGNDNNGRWV